MENRAVEEMNFPRERSSAYDDLQLEDLRQKQPVLQNEGEAAKGRPASAPVTSIAHSGKFRKKKKVQFPKRQAKKYEKSEIAAKAKEADDIIHVSKEMSLLQRIQIQPEPVELHAYSNFRTWRGILVLQGIECYDSRPGRHLSILLTLCLSLIIGSSVHSSFLARKLTTMLGLLNFWQCR